MLKNSGVTAMIEQDLYKKELQWAGWASPRPFLYTHAFFKIIKAPAALYSQEDS
jgi:hypothetical protein